MLSRITDPEGYSFLHYAQSTQFPVQLVSGSFGCEKGEHHIHSQNIFYGFLPPGMNSNLSFLCGFLSPTVSFYFSGTQSISCPLLWAFMNLPQHKMQIRLKHPLFSLPISNYRNREDQSQVQKGPTLHCAISLSFYP